LLIVLVVTGAGLAGCTGGGDRDPGQAWISVSPLRRWWTSRSW
jgi:hypothetical protein